MPEIPKSIKHPNQLLQQSRGALKAIYKHSQALLAIQSIVCDLVPGIQVASYTKDGLLHLVTPSAALATRLKYSQRELVAALRRAKKPCKVKSIKISVRPESYERPRPTRPVLPPSAKNAQHMVTAAQYIEDPPLRKALIKLSQHATSQNEDKSGAR